MFALADLVCLALFETPAARALPVLLLVLSRTGALCAVAPWLGYRSAAGVTRVALGLGLTLAFTPLGIASAPALPAGFTPLVLMAAREALVGLGFAVAVSAPLFALEWAGRLFDRQRAGFARSRADSPLAQLHLFAGLVLFVLLGGHRLALAAFAQTFVDAPVAVAVDAASLQGFALGAARVVGDALLLAVAFAAPAAIAFVLLELAFGLAARVSPHLGGWASAMPLRAALGLALALLTLAALLPRLGPTFAESVQRGGDLVSPAGP